MKYFLLLPCLALVGCMGASAPQSVSSYDAVFKEIMTPKMSCDKLKKDMDENEAIISAINRGAYSTPSAGVKFADVFDMSAWSRARQKHVDVNASMKLRFEGVLEKQKVAYAQRCQKTS